MDIVSCSLSHRALILGEAIYHIASYSMERPTCQEIDLCGQSVMTLGLPTALGISLGANLPTVEALSDQ